MSYCWSLDEELYRGHCNSVEEALAEAVEEAYENNGVDAGKEITVYVGTVRPAADIVRGMNAKRLGAWIAERVEEDIGEEIAADDTVMDTTPVQDAEIGRLVLDWLADHAEFNAWGVDDAKEHRVIVPAHRREKEVRDEHPKLRDSSR